MNEVDPANYLDLDIESKRDLLEKWNQAYRTGNALVSDILYDEVLASLPEEDALKSKVGFEVSDSRKTQLPIPMYSMDKVKSVEEIHKWMESKKLEETALVVVTPKYDGLSFLYQYGKGKAYTRGNGKEGQQSDLHFQKLIEGKKYGRVDSLEGKHFIGEVIMKKKTFLSRYAENYRNPRNLVAGLFNQKNVDQSLTDVDFIAYGLGEEEGDKVEMIQNLNQYNLSALPYKILPLKELSQEILEECYQLWLEDYEIDGLILELNDGELRKKLGREKNGNPCYARAWKGYQESSKETTLNGITYQVSKEGRLSAVGHVDPVELDGVTVSNVTLYNASTIKEKQWGIGARVRIIRSGMVIPKIIETLEPVEAELPKKCPSCQSAVVWDDNHVHLICPNHEGCREQRLQRIIFFFQAIEVEEVGEGVVEQFFQGGYDNIEKILKLKKEDLVELDRFAERKAELVYHNIHKKLNPVSIEALQHASGFFKGLGNKKLALVSRYDRADQKPSMEELLAIDGFSETSAKAYLDGFDRFWEFIAPLPVTLTKTEQIALGKQCEEMSFCFTGVRNKEFEKKIREQGGKVISGVSKNTTHVIAKDPSGNSSKLKKARELELHIWNLEELSQFFETAEE